MKYFILFASALFISQASAQEAIVANDSLTTYNRFTVEGMIGFSDGNYPYGNGFSAGDKQHVLSHFTINSFDFGVRYMFTPKFGIKGNLAYSQYTEADKGSLPYKTNHFNLSLQGVVNAAKILDFSPETRVGLLLHGGLQVGSLTSKTAFMLAPVLGQVPNENLNNTEYHGGFVAGITPQYRITPKLALFVDLSVYFNYRQHMNWDGTVATTNDLYGKNTNLSFGISYALGSDNIHGDWKVKQDPNELKVAALLEKIDEIEVKLQDTDRDGVVDYLDVEPNTVGGVTVDTKGRAIDLNKNGVPDELEGRNGKRSFNSNDQGSSYEGASLLEQGIVNVFLDTNKDTPNTASANNLFYVISFLKNNPEANVRITGYADTTGDEQMNKDLAKRRAQNISNYLLNSEIKASQIQIVGQGEDKSMDNSSKTGLQLARRVSFELIK